MSSKKYLREYYIKNKEKILKQQKEYNKSERGKTKNKIGDKKYKKSKKGKVSQLFYDAKRRAKKYNREFCLTKEWLQEKIEKGVCEVTGVKFVYTKKEKYKTAPFAPSLDRKNSKLGYTEKNTQIVINAFNITKWQWDKTDLKKLLVVLQTVKI